MVSQIHLVIYVLICVIMLYHAAVAVRHLHISHGLAAMACPKVLNLPLESLRKEMPWWSHQNGWRIPCQLHRHPITKEWSIGLRIFKYVRFQIDLKLLKHAKTLKISETRNRNDQTFMNSESPDPTVDRLWWQTNLADTNAGYVWPQRCRAQDPNRLLCRWLTRLQCFGCLQPVPSLHCDSERPNLS